MEDSIIDFGWVHLFTLDVSERPQSSSQARRHLRDQRALGAFGDFARGPAVKLTKMSRNVQGTHTHIYGYVCMYMYIYIHMYTHTHLNIYIHIRVKLCVYIYIYID